MITLFLVRHAQTDANVTGLIAGSTDVPLSDEGQRQARALGSEFDCDECRIHYVYTSDLLRAKETNLYWRLGSNRYTSEPPSVITPLLRERDFGRWENRPQSETGRPLHPAYRWIFDLDGDCEPIDSVVARAREFLRMLLLLHQGHNVMAIAHGFFNSCLTALLLDGEVGQDNIYRQFNTGVSVFQLSDEGHLIKARLNDIAHLTKGCIYWNETGRRFFGIGQG